MQENQENMANTKNYSTRLKVLDHYLSSGHAYTGRELIAFCNRALEERGEHPITSRTTLADDLLNIENEYKCIITRKKVGRATVYQYADPNFSIFSTDLTEDDLSHLAQAMNILRRFEGMPNTDWLQELNTRLNMCMSNHETVRSIVGFEPTLYNKGMEHFNSLFNAIRRKEAVEIIYQSFKMPQPQHLIVHPYYLKQYNNRWFLFCCTGDYTNLSNYPLDRIQAVRSSDVDYRDTDIDFKEYFKDIIGVTKEAGKPVERVLLRFPKAEYPYVATKPWHPSQKIVERDGANVTIELHVIPNYELEQRILSWGNYVEVLQPAPLRNKIKDRISAIHLSYGR